MFIFCMMKDIHTKFEADPCIGFRKGSPKMYIGSFHAKSPKIRKNFPGDHLRF